MADERQSLVVEDVHAANERGPRRSLVSMPTEYRMKAKEAAADGVEPVSMVTPGAIEMKSPLGKHKSSRHNKSKSSKSSKSSKTPAAGSGSGAGSAGNGAGKSSRRIHGASRRSLKEGSNAVAVSPSKATSSRLGSPSKAKIAAGKSSTNSQSFKWTSKRAPSGAVVPFDASNKALDKEARRARWCRLARIAAVLLALIAIIVLVIVVLLTASEAEPEALPDQVEGESCTGVGACRSSKALACVSGKCASVSCTADSHCDACHQCLARTCRRCTKHPLLGCMCKG